MLLFKKRFFEAIRHGRKTTTLRYWTHRRVRPNSVHLAPGLGRLTVQDVTVVTLDDLTDADAQADGFDSLGDLRNALRQMYTPRQRRSLKLYKVCFTLQEPADAD